MSISVSPIKVSSQIKSTKNPIMLYRMMKLYSKERHEKFPNLEAVVNSIDSMSRMCGMRVLKDKFGNLLAAYTYKIRTNRMSQKSMFIDVLVRNRKNPESKNIMNNIYQDIKDLAIKKEAKEITLFSIAKDRALRSRYEKLGFQKDESVDIDRGYIMRVKVQEFFKNTMGK